MNEIVRRATVDEIVGRRERALELYDRAHAALVVAFDAMAEARQAAASASPGVTSYNWQSDEARKKFLGVIEVPEREEFLAQARRLTDIDVWSYIIRITDLERLMDKKAKDDLRQQLMTDPPEATVDNIIATLTQFRADAGTIFKRGIAECFSNLDRRFRSHDGWKIGSRVILSGAFDEWGHWSYHRNHRDTLHDIERTFLVMDGKEVPPDYGGIVGEVEEARRTGGFGARQTEIESDYFRIRIFKNGNAHIWFKRDDLLRQVNQLLGEYYAAPIPEERAYEDDGGLHEPKTTLAKNYGFYPTPELAASILIDEVPLYRRDGEPRLTVLEPSAGSGNLASLCVAEGAIVDCIEYQAELAASLRGAGLYRNVICVDFLALKPSTTGLYDRVVMNPPFDRERDIDHVMHALSFLKDDGHLSAIMSAGTEFRETRKSTAFRALMEEMNANWRDLPPGSFASVGTYCNTIILMVWKRAAA